MPYTADDLIDEVRLEANLPPAAEDDNLTDAEILRMADKLIQRRWIPFVHSAQGYYRVTSKTVEVSSEGVRVPKRAVGATLDEIKVSDSNGNDLYNIPEITIEKRGSYESSYHYDRLSYSFEGDIIKFQPSDTSISHVKLYYQWRPGKLVETSSSRVMEITSISGAELSGTPNTNWDANTLFDVVQAVPNYDLLLDETAPTGDPNATASVIFSSEVSGVAVGDYVVEHGYTPVIHLPEEVFPLLVSSIVVRCLMRVGDTEQASYESDILEKDSQAVKQLLIPRNRGENRKIVNRYSPLRSNGYRTWRY